MANCFTDDKWWRGWEKVPAGAVLEARVEPEDADYVCNGRVVGATGIEVEWAHNDLVPGPGTLVLTAGSHLATVRVRFEDSTSGSARVIFEARHNGVVIRSLCFEVFAADGLLHFRGVGVTSE
jgi:hypothetical protein